MIKEKEKKNVEMTKENNKKKINVWACYLLGYEKMPHSQPATSSLKATFSARGLQLGGRIPKTWPQALLFENTIFLNM